MAELVPAPREPPAMLCEWQQRASGTVCWAGGWARSGAGSTAPEEDSSMLNLAWDHVPICTAAVTSHTKMQNKPGMASTPLSAPGLRLAKSCI